MTTVAERLGVKHQSLYRHVRGREALVIAAMDMAVRAVEWPRPQGRWRPYLEGVAAEIWGLFARHPGMAGEVRAVSRTPAAVTEVFYTTAAELARLGFTDGDAVLIVDTIADLAADSYLGWERLTRPRRGGPVTLDLLRETWAGDHQQPAARPYAVVIREILDGEPRLWFDRKLALVLDGAAARWSGTAASGSGSGRGGSGPVGR